MDAMAATMENRTLEKFEKRNDRAIRDFGYGATVGGISLTERCLEPLTETFRKRFANANRLKTTNPNKPLVLVLRNLSPEVVALCALQSAIHAVALDRNIRDTSLTMGTALHGEVFAAGLLRHNSRLAAKIDRAVRKRHGSHKYRTQAARSAAARAGFQGTHWDREERMRAGFYLWTCVVEACGWAFAMDGNRPTMTPEALAVVEAAVSNDIALHPVLLPLKEPPLPWTGFTTGGYHERRYSSVNPIVRTRNKEAVADIKAAIADGTMQPVLDALNAIQGVGWSINEPILELLEWSYENDQRVKGLPRKTDIPPLHKPEDWDTLDEDRQLAWRKKAGAIHTRNRGLVSDRVLFAEDLRTARLLSGGPFFTPCNIDWRGRVYPLPHFNFQRDDRVRAMFLFSEGVAVGERGTYWLKVHVANTGDFDKISKRPIAERIQWVEANWELVRATASNPYEDKRWQSADTPFMFVAACIELVNAVEYGPSYVTRLPVSFDGSCSGLQHLCAMTRAEEGKYVNLTVSELPQDVYELVAQVVRKRVEAEAAEGNELALLWTTFGIDRKVVKRNVMTYSYSSKAYGMSEQHMEDRMRPLSDKVLEGEIPAHPFGDDDGLAASRYIAKHVYAAIEEIVTRPAQAMEFLQRCARAMAHEGKPLNWTTPAGLPWSNRYHVPLTKHIELWLHDVRITTRLTVGDQKEIDKDKAANGVAPNFVHACDAAHLMLTVNAAQAEGITQQALVHDSFGCLAPYADRYNAIIRERFVGMYEDHDVLAEVLERATSELTLPNTQRLPDAVDMGGLNLKEVLDAQYAFA